MNVKVKREQPGVYGLWYDGIRVGVVERSLLARLCKAAAEAMR